jgi:hypothetical protein
MQVAVLTIDQRGSRRGPDRVPQVLSLLGADPRVTLLRGLERTAGDELQGVLTEPAALTRVVEVLLRESSWSIGIGIGPVELPLPESTRAGRGAAFVRARDAVTSAKSSPSHLRVVGGDVSGSRALETCLWLWGSLLSRRTAGGWEVADLVDTGASYDEVARRLGVSSSAISQRAQAAGLVEGLRARELVTALVADLLGQDVTP